MSHNVANLLLVYFYWSIGTVKYDVQCFCYVEGSGNRLDYCRLELIPARNKEDWNWFRNGMYRLVPELGTSGARYSRNHKPVMLGIPGTSGAQYHRVYIYIYG